MRQARRKLMPGFKEALPYILRYEGGFVDDPADPGGATNYGVTQGVYDGYRQARELPKLSVKLIKHEEVEAIYEAQYWKAAHCEDLAWPASLALFDMAVNMGVGGAVKQLQYALKIKPDGVYGPVTKTAAQSRDAKVLALDIVDRRDQRYVEIVKGRPTSIKFLSGWLKRTADLRRVCIGL
jgi:lysozyme family protein